MTPLALLSIGPFEFVVLAAAAVLLFGGDLPDVARKAAMWVQKIRAMSADLNREFQSHVPDVDLDRPPARPAPPQLEDVVPEEVLGGHDAGSVATTAAASDVLGAPGGVDPHGATDADSTSDDPQDDGLGRREDVPPDGWERPAPRAKETVEEGASDGHAPDADETDEDGKPT